MTKQFQTGMPRLSLAQLVVPKVKREPTPRPHPRDRAYALLIHGDTLLAKQYALLDRLRGRNFYVAT